MVHQPIERREGSKHIRLLCTPCAHRRRLYAFGMALRSKNDSVIGAAKTLGAAANAFDIKGTRRLCIHVAYAQKRARKRQMRLVEIECLTGWSTSTLDRNLGKFGKRADLYGERIPSGNDGDRGNRNQIQCYDLDKIDAWLAEHYPRVHENIHKALELPAPDRQSLDAKQTVEQAMNAKIAVILREVRDYLDEGRLDLAREAIKEQIDAVQAGSISSFATRNAQRPSPDQWAIDRVNGSFDEYVEAAQAGGVLSMMTLAEVAAWPRWTSESRRQDVVQAWVRVLTDAEQQVRMAVHKADAHPAIAKERSGPA